MNEAPNYSMFFDLRGRRDSPTKNRLIKTLRLKPADGITIQKRRGETYQRNMQEFCSKFMGPQGDLLFSCGAGPSPCVDPYGVLQSCLPLRHPDMVYDLKKGSLKDALINYFPRLRAKTRATNPAYLARCARCFLHGLCLQCPAKSWAEYGTLDTPVEYFCRVAHAEARDLGLLRERELAWEVTGWKERIKGI
jgi:radical SAM protein with 4Fe4S-binding SPASM domain